MALGLAPSPKVWGAPCARVSKVRVRPCPKPVASMRAEGTQASEDALAQADDVRVGQSAAGPSVFASTYAVARGPLIPLVGSQTIPNIPPKMLPPPPVDVMPVFEFTGHGSLEDLAIAINTLLAKTLPETGAMLLRDLPFKSAAELKPLLQKLQETGDPDDWSLMTFSAFGRSRKQVDGLDTASTFSPERVLQCHNELGFNPRMPKRISFACIKDAADGGETLLARNADLTEVIPAEFQAWIREHGGVRYTRRYYDATVGKPADKYVFTTWQEMCSISEGQGRKEAEQYFIDVGYDPASISWEDDGCLVVTNVIKGFLPGKEPGQEMWSVGIQAPYRPNIMRGGDGELLPEDLFNEADRRQWDVTYAFRLLPSDLLIMDNLQVQHGRLPYSDAKGVDPRLLITLMV